MSLLRRLFPSSLRKILYHLAAAALILSIGTVTSNICINPFLYFRFISFTPLMALLVLFGNSTSLSLKHHVFYIVLLILHKAFPFIFNENLSYTTSPNLIHPILLLKHHVSLLYEIADLTHILYTFPFIFNENLHILQILSIPNCHFRTTTGM